MHPHDHDSNTKFYRSPCNKPAKTTKGWQWYEPKREFKPPTIQIPDHIKDAPDSITNAIAKNATPQSKPPTLRIDPKPSIAKSVSSKKLTDPQSPTLNSPMKITIRKYQQEDFEDLDYCLVQLQDYLSKMDPLKRLRRAPNYSPQYAKNILAKVAKQDGAIFLAYDDSKIIGCIVGFIEKQSQHSLLECVATHAGRIIDLFVSSEYRGLGIGKQLITKMEDHMRKKQCDVMRIEVFEPNQSAHNFYKNLDYQDRVIDMIKPLK